MNRDTDNLADVQWLASCAKRLREQWPRADVASIDETALELWSAEWLREMSGEEAAALWLRPLTCKCGSCSNVSWPAAQITAPEAREHLVLGPARGGQELADLRLQVEDPRGLAA